MMITDIFCHTGETKKDTGRNGQAGLFCDHNIEKDDSQPSLESKTYVMFIAGIVRNYLYQGLKEVAKKEKNRKYYTVPAAISELEKIIVVKNSKEKYIRKYGLTAKQKKILGQFGIKETDINRLAALLNLRI